MACIIAWICCSCVANCGWVFCTALATWSTGAFVAVGVFVCNWYCWKASCSPATTLCTMLEWCIAESSTVRSYFSLISRWIAPASSVFPECNSTQEFPARTCPSCGLLRRQCLLPEIVCMRSLWCQQNKVFSWLQITRLQSVSTGCISPSWQIPPVPGAHTVSTNRSCLVSV